MRHRLDQRRAGLEHGLLVPMTLSTKPDCAVNNPSYDLPRDEHIKFY